ncbi:MAG: CBS domain-containing protein [Candidatus Bipolaricaulota bacterium]|nr:CBS domain-containing protein [Candidatus Bipolaricaulota bacterium]MDW8151643.1 CBS domain-containing protein [Candidatus Bipolaricaulota bacterium]
MLVREWMTPAPHVPATASVGEARERAEAGNLAVLFVVDEQGRLKGFLTRRALAAAPSPELPVEKVLTPPQDVLTPEDPIERAAVLLGHYLVLPVVDGERHLVGVLSKDRLLQALAHLAALGEEGLRIRLRPRGPEEVYRALAVLAAERATLVAVLRGCEGEVILHVQGVRDPQALRQKLEEALR